MQTMSFEKTSSGLRHRRREWHLPETCNEQSQPQYLMRHESKIFAEDMPICRSLWRHSSCTYYPPGDWSKTSLHRLIRCRLLTALRYNMIQQLAITPEDMQSILPVVQASMLAQHHRRQHLVPAAAQAATTMHRVALASTGLRLRHGFWALSMSCASELTHNDPTISNACLRRWRWHLPDVHAVHGSTGVTHAFAVPERQEQRLPSHLAPA